MQLSTTGIERSGHLSGICRIQARGCGAELDKAEADLELCSLAHGELRPHTQRPAPVSWASRVLEVGPRLGFQP